MKYREAVANGWKVVFPIRHRGRVDGDVCDKELKRCDGRRRGLMYVEAPCRGEYHYRLYMRRDGR